MSKVQNGSCQKSKTEVVKSPKRKLSKVQNKKVSCQKSKTRKYVVKSPKQESKLSSSPKSVIESKKCHRVQKVSCQINKIKDAQMQKTRPSPSLKCKYSESPKD